MVRGHPSKIPRQDETDSSSSYLLCSMIVLDVDLADVRELKPECQPIVARNAQAPDTSSITLERMQPPAGDGCKFRNILGFFQRSQHRTKFIFVLPGDTTRLIASPEPFEVLVSEADDAHELFVRRNRT